MAGARAGPAASPAGRLAACLAAWLAGRLPAWPAAWLAGRLAACLAGWLAGWQQLLAALAGGLLQGSPAQMLACFATPLLSPLTCQLIHTARPLCLAPCLQGKEVEYSLRLLPLGGFVAFPDDDPESPYEREHRRCCRSRQLPLHLPPCLLCCRPFSPSRVPLCTVGLQFTA